MGCELNPGVEHDPERTCTGPLDRNKDTCQITSGVPINSYLSIWQQPDFNSFLHQVSAGSPSVPD